MNPAPDRTLDDPQQTIAELQRQLAEAVAERDEAQQQLIERTAERDDGEAQQTAITEVLGVINSSPSDLAPVFDAMLEKAMRLCGAAFSLMIVSDGDEAPIVAARGVPAAFAEFRRKHPVSLVKGPFFSRLLAGEDFVHTIDLKDDDAYRRGDPLRRAIVDLGGGRTSLIVALRRDREVLGAIHIYRQESRPFTDKQIALLQNFAAQAVIAMENARLITETREALDQQTATAEVLGVINSSPGDLAPVFEAMLEKALNLCGAALGTLYTYDGELMHAAAIRGASPECAEFLRRGPHRPGAGALGRVVRGAPVVQIADLAADEVYHAVPLGRALVDLGKIRTNIVVPLRKDGAVLGAIAIYRQEVRPFTDKQIALLQNFAAQAVIAMENARLITETREALDQQTATSEVLGVINSSPGDLGPVFDAILEKARSLCGAVHGALVSYDGEHFRAVATHGLPEPLEGLLRTPFRPNPVHQALLSGERLIHIADQAAVETDTSIGRASVGAGARTLLLVPLRKDGALLGYITASRWEVRPFSDKEIALLENFAAQAVIAIENARLITETREALEQQTATAEVLQVINASPGDLAPVFDVLLEKATQVCEAAFGIMNTYDGERFHTVAVHCLPPALAETYRHERPPPGPHSPLTLIAQGKDVVSIDDLTVGPGVDLPRRRILIEQGGARSWVAVALRKDGPLLGTISAYRTEVRPFSNKQIALLQNFAAQAVIAMENARLLGELRQRTDEVGELNRGLEARVAEQVDELGRVGRLKRFLAPQLAELIVSQGDEKILESHRREIVVVFCDLRGYTAFTETAEPEEVLDFLRQYHGALGPLVSQYEGTLDQFSGDGIMVFFNDPVPCADPAERAVKMAVAMRSAASMLIADWRERGRDLGFGAGIAQGYATLGQIGFSERSGYTAIGTVCNVAARLCAEAKDGQILLGQLVNVALKGSVATEQLGPLTLKGLSQPVVAYNVPLVAISPALRVIEGGSPETV